MHRNLKTHNILSYNNISSSYADDVITTIYIDLKDNNQYNNIRAIVAILHTYEEFSKVSALVNNDTKTVFATCFMKDEPRFEVIRNYLVNNHNSVLSNFKYSGYEIKLLGHSIALSVNEASNNNGEGFLCSSLKERFDKVRLRAERWCKVTYFPNVFARSLAAKTYLISEFQYLLSNASLSENLFGRCQKPLSNFINKKKSLNHLPSF